MHELHEQMLMHMNVIAKNHGITYPFPKSKNAMNKDNWRQPIQIGFLWKHLFHHHIDIGSKTFTKSLWQVWRNSRAEYVKPI